MWFLRLFRQFRELEARLANAESQMADMADQLHDAQVQVKLLTRSERRAFKELTLQAKRREDWYAMNARLAPIHFATPDHQNPNPPDMNPVKGKPLGREVQSEKYAEAIEQLQRELMKNVQ